MTEQEKAQLFEHLKQITNFPEGLDETDKDLIVRQCEQQNAVSKEQLDGFAKAYKYAKDVAHDRARLEAFDQEGVKSLIHELGAMIEKRNERGFRLIPVTFADGTTTLPPDEIPHAIENFSEAYADSRLEPSLAFFEFERIHPFEDGNGRTGDLLWKIAVTRQTGRWPQSLPPPYEPGGANHRKSAFGDIEEN